ncbi:PP2C family protein-serine/threonine phosphatase [Kitasatospora cheerisanensis]|uniref:Putative serine/threonine protein phosphatase n=1 Tax=Kitasatospora cheerisanensis KCTC 2395 TaxID=1348663 RepID=A0A066Z4Q5_9ACTN|nr:PP2C family protein-serine/threonine phosphatase [Kitasatospora cheerisanensis]KDN87194.1 putative serine/threonine protein phosphatase [Kitasatospora cheerisanensis KCTC 2395]
MPDETLPLNHGEQLLERFLVTGRTLDPREAPRIAEEYTRALGLGASTVYLADIQQHRLVAMGDGIDLPIDHTLAGWAFRTGSMRVTDDGGAGLVAWFPLVDGAERLGVLGLRTAALDRETIRRCRLLTALLAMMITSKRDTSDSYAHGTRSDTMTLPAEMLRAFLPPRTVCTERAISTAVLEPAYQLGGDAFEHSLADGVLHAAVLDAMGHDLASGLTAALALGACRNARRNGADLPDLVASIDRAMHDWYPDRFATGVFLRLDLATGTLHWANCGHPPPLLIRADQVVTDALAGPGELPLGLAHLTDRPRTVRTVSLQPGDRLLIYTDGVVDAKGASHEFFGLSRFTDFVIRATAAGEPAPEALRRLMHAVPEHQDDRLTDDATIMMIEWQTATPPLLDSLGLSRTAAW